MGLLAEAGDRVHALPLRGLEALGELGEILVGNLDREIKSLEFAREGLVLLGTISMTSKSEQQIGIRLYLGFGCQRLRGLPTSPRPCLHEKALPIYRRGCGLND